MPNHIDTSIEIMGPKDKLAKLIKDTKIKLDANVEENEFDLNGIIPMPPELQIESGSSTDLGMAAMGDEKQFAFYHSCKWFSEKFPGVETPEQLREFLEKSGDESNLKALKQGKQALENLKKYGHKDWYDWSVDKWGTKWGAYDVHYIAHDDNHLLFTMQSAWDTPRPIWDHLREMGFTVNGIISGEMDGTDTIGDGGPFWVSTTVEHSGDLSVFEED